MGRQVLAAVNCPPRQIANFFSEVLVLGVNALVRRSLWNIDHGVHIALAVDPDDESVLIFRSGRAPQVARTNDAIDLTDVLPGFELTADQVFACLRLEG